MAGINSDHTEAAIITPAAKPRKALCTFFPISFLKMNTTLAPRAVIKKVNPVPAAAQLIAWLIFSSFPPPLP
jgi:hypothetical protein